MKTFKKILCTFLIIVMCITTVPFQKLVEFESSIFGFGIKASANTVSSSGYCGENVTYSYDSLTGELVISGTGAMFDYYDYYQNHYHHSSIFYNSDIKSVVIENGVTSIGEYAFHYCRNLTSITIPDSVTTIGNYAFYDCIKLKNITIPNSVTTIGDCVFSGCTSLSAITIPDSVTSIGCDAFYNTSYYNNTTNWKNNVLYIGNHLIKANASILGDYTIKNGTLTIVPFAFSDCNSLSSITIPDSIITIGNYAFKNCANLISVTIPDGVSTINEGTFQHCCKLTSITIPNSITSIGSYAFSDCNHLETINIPNSVTYIGADILKNTAWFNYKSKGIITIDGWIYGYKGAENNVTVNIDKAIKGIAYSTFRSNSNIIEYVVESDNLYYSSENGVLFNKDKSILIEYPCGKMDISSYVIPDTVKEIKDYAFYDCKYIYDLTISNNVEAIDPTAFGNCKLTVLNIDIKYIPDKLFSNCSNLNTLILGNNVEVIGDYAFEQCNSLRNITVGCGIKTIGIAAFDYEKSYKRSVYINDLETWCNIEFLSESSNPMYNFWVSYADAYYSSSSCLYINGVEATNITIPNTITKIKPYAFYMCRSIKNITIPDGVTSIGDRAFAICVGLTSVVLPNSVEIIGSDAFCVCENITNITLSKNLKSIGSYAFNKCTSLKDVFYPGSQEDWDKVTIGYYNDNLLNAALFLMHKHDYTVTIIKEFTCTTAGSKKFTCICGATYTEVVPATGHINLTIDNGKAATTTEVGYTAGKYCNDCKIWIEGHVEIPKLHSHSYTATIIKTATCTATGTKKFTCSCGDTYTEVIPATGHINLITDSGKPATTTEVGYTAGKYCNDCKIWVEGHVEIPKLHSHSYTATIIKTATCITTGTKKFTCSCGDTYTETISATGHINLTIDNGKPATTTEVGHTAGKYCNDCKTWIEGHVEIPKLHSHSYTANIIKTATCTTTGTKKFTCSCGDTYTDTIPATGHINLTIDSGKPATTTEVGYTAGKYCNDCKIWIEGHIEIPKLHSHSYDTLITKTATCTATGTKKFTCSCGDTYTDTIPATGHINITTDSGKPATTTEEGYTAGKYCNDCKTWIEGHNEIPKLNDEHKHSYSGSITKAATCTEVGVKTFTCSCGDKYTESISMIAHEYITETWKATLATDGGYKSLCKYCGKITGEGVYHSPDTIELTDTEYTYDGKTKKPTVFVEDKMGVDLKEETDYTVKYESGRKAPGKYTVTITFIGKYEGEKVLEFSILPGKTSKITATQSASSIKLTWKKVTGATGYRIYQYNSKTKKYEKIKTTTETSYTIKKLKAGTSYKFAIKAYTKDNGETLWAASSKSIKTATEPAVPTVKITAGTKKATLKWNKVTGATGYVVYMKNSDGSYDKLGSTKSTSYTKKSLKSGKKYYFRVRAYKTVDGKNIYGGYKTYSVKVK